LASIWPDLRWAASENAMPQGGAQMGRLKGMDLSLPLAALIVVLFLAAPQQEVVSATSGAFKNPPINRRLKLHTQAGLPIMHPPMDTAPNTATGIARQERFNIIPSQGSISTLKAVFGYRMDCCRIGLK
jgi:hypothetical protein